MWLRGFIISAKRKKPTRLDVSLNEIGYNARGLYKFKLYCIIKNAGSRNQLGGFYMKQFLKSSIFAAMLVALTVPAICTTPAGYAMIDKVNNQAIVGQALTFDKIEKTTTVAVSQTNVLCATDIVSTNTAAVYYLHDTVVYPIELEVQTLGSVVINYDAYSTTVGTGVNVPIVLDPAMYTKDGASLISSKSTKMVFYQKPNICFSAVTVATTTFIIRSISKGGL